MENKNMLRRAYCELGVNLFKFLRPHRDDSPVVIINQKLKKKRDTCADYQIVIFIMSWTYLDIFILKINKKLIIFLSQMYAIKSEEQQHISKVYYIKI